MKLLAVLNPRARCLAAWMALLRPSAKPFERRSEIARTIPSRCFFSVPPKVMRGLRRLRCAQAMSRSSAGVVVGGDNVAQGFLEAPGARGLEVA